MFLLAEPHKGRKDTVKSRHDRNLARVWANEPPWRGEQTEAAAETGAGSLEPEG
jgi:hypothetical protein